MSPAPREEEASLSRMLTSLAGIYILQSASASASSTRPPPFQMNRTIQLCEVQKQSVSFIHE